uniref:C-type lectin domain-containing protein n=1 Tax=Electrophorus electricus TaxID=8005 RepID=A0A4W4E1L5_ELEEL
MSTHICIQGQPTFGLKINFKVKTNVVFTVLLYIFYIENTCVCLPVAHTDVDYPMKWSDAQQYCKTNYDDLSTVSTIDEISHYYSWCMQGKWIGLHSNISYPTDWKWSSGENEPFCPRNYMGQPSLDPGGYCVLLSSSGECYSADCSWHLGFFCMNMYEVVLVQQNLTWEDALDYCRENYLDLGSLRSENWMNDAVAVSKAAQTAYVWIGLRFLAGQWIWTSTGDMDHNAWSVNVQPQCPPRNLRCGALEHMTGIWQPGDCEDKLNFVCFQRTLHSSSSPLPTSSSSLSSSNSG